MKIFWFYFAGRSSAQLKADFPRMFCVCADGTISRPKKRKEVSLDNCEKTVEKRHKAGGKKAEVDTGPEEGELIKEVLLFIFCILVSYRSF